MHLLCSTILVLLCGALAAEADSSYETQPLPNVILVVTDDQDVVLKGMVS